MKHKSISIEDITKIITKLSNPTAGDTKSNYDFNRGVSWAFSNLISEINNIKPKHIISPVDFKD